MLNITFLLNRPLNLHSFVSGAGSSWKIAATINEPPRTQKTWDPTTRCALQSYFSDRWVFTVQLAEAVSTTKIRLTVRDVTFGGTVNFDDWNNTNGAIRGDRQLVLREIEAYSGVPAAFSISGVVNDVSGAMMRGMADVNVALSGSKTAVTTTDANGKYSFPGLPAGGDYVVTPASNGTRFVSRMVDANEGSINGSAVSNLDLNTEMDFFNPAGDGLVGAYYKGDNENLTAANLKATRIDSQVNFDWGYGGPWCGALAAGDCEKSPPKGIGINEFEIRWTGKLQALSTEVYTLRTESNDGARLWVNGVKLFENWTVDCCRNQAGRWLSQNATVAMTAGERLDIVMEFKVCAPANDHTSCHF